MKLVISLDSMTNTALKMLEPVQAHLILDATIVPDFLIPSKPPWDAILMQETAVRIATLCLHAARVTDRKGRSIMSAALSVDAFPKGWDANELAFLQSFENGRNSTNPAGKIVLNCNYTFPIVTVKGALDKSQGTFRVDSVVTGKRRPSLGGSRPNGGESLSDQLEPPPIAITGPTRFQVQASRLGNGDGRLYTIDFSSADCNHLVTNGQVFVKVPQDQGTN